MGKTMYHSPLLQPDVLRDLPALLDDLRPRADEPAVLCYRSEAFAEDLVSNVASPGLHHAPAQRRRRGRRSALLFATPLCVALAGAAVVLFGLA
jgi:hypothetical protein